MNKKIESLYENFVYKFEISNDRDKQNWHGAVDFSALKLKLIASIVAISGIHLLKVFMEVEKTPESQIRWMIIIHLVFVISAFLLAAMNYIAMSTKSKKKIS